MPLAYQLWTLRLCVAGIAAVDAESVCWLAGILEVLWLVCEGHKVSTTTPAVMLLKT